MTNLLRNSVYKIIHECEECGGEGKSGALHMPSREYVDCSKCNGKGFVIPLEEWCEVLHTDEEYGERIYTVLEIRSSRQRFLYTIHKF